MTKSQPIKELQPEKTPHKEPPVQVPPIREPPDDEPTQKDPEAGDFPIKVEVAL